MKVSVEDMQRRVRAETGMPGRLAHTALLVAGLGMTTLSASLLLTESALPARTQAAFGAIAVIGIAWAAFAAWVLARRKVLFGRQRIVASRMAVAFTLLFLAGAVGLRERIGYGGVFTAGLLCAAALGAWAQAHRRVAALMERRRALDSGRA